ncbi:MAG: hypothetical protein PHY30_01680 [Candidatus Pacebacteria bacterium]|nr:hypothetical protein [Candidatus Paceibacterota bacterium]
MPKLDYKTKITIGFLIFILNILLQSFYNLNSYIYSLLTGFAVFFLVLGFKEKRFVKEPRKDERTDKIAAYSGFLTFYATFIAIAILWQLYYLFNIAFDYNILLGSMFFGMLLIYFIARVYYNKKI